MKNDVLNDKLIAAVKCKLPAGANLAATLSDILSLGKEAVYRRLRGEVPFTFFEVAQISEKMSICLSEIVGSSISGGAVFRLNEIRFVAPREHDYAHYVSCINALKALENDPTSERGTSSNTLPQNVLIPYTHLSRFCRFKWQYQNSFNETAIPYGKIEVPEKLAAIEKDYVRGLNAIRNTTYIWDSMIFQFMVNDIKYFEHVRLLAEEDIKKIKEELYLLIDDLEDMAASGVNQLGNKVQMYISNTNFETTYSYVQGACGRMSFIRVFTLNTASSCDEVIFDCLKKWILSLRRHSVLISESGEMHRVQFFRKQRELVDSI